VLRSSILTGANDMTAVALSRIMPPPAKPLEADGSWLQVEENLGIALLDDFKEFIRIYGSGRISNFRLRAKSVL
jgi:hypothetical protein